MRFLVFVRVAAVVLCLVSVASPAGAQDFREFFSLSTPGARGNAMGRAFIGVADDASATITNPAGLVLLTRPQVSLEFKTANREEDAFGDQIGSPASLSYIGASTPLGSRFAAAFVRHEYLRFKDDFFGFDQTGVTYGGSFAAIVVPDLMVGVTVAGHKSDVTIDDPFDDVGLVEGFNDTTTGVTLGALWRANEMLTIGIAGATAGDPFVMPNRAGVGVGLRPNEKALMALDVTWVGYSDSLVAKDATELHLGGEYELVATDQMRVLGRAGYFRVSATEIFDFDDDGNFITEERPENVGTFGAGFVFGPRLQVDVAVLTRGEAVVSAGLRF